MIGWEAERKGTARHISVDELPEEERFQQLSTPSKHLIDTLKMIAYRADTAMANLLRETMSHHDEAHSLLRALYQSDADLLPDHKKGIATPKPDMDKIRARLKDAELLHQELTR